MNIEKAEGHLESLPKAIYKKLKNASKVAICAAIMSGSNVAMGNELQPGLNQVGEPSNHLESQIVTAKYAGQSFDLNKKDVLKLVTAKHEYNENMDVLSSYMKINDISEQKFLTSLDNGLTMKDIKMQMGSFFRSITLQDNTPLDQHAGKNDYLFEEAVEAASSSYMNSIGRTQIEMDRIFNSAPNHFKLSVIEDVNKELNGSLSQLQSKMPEHFVRLVDTRMSQRSLTNLKMVLEHKKEFDTLNINGIKKSFLQTPDTQKRKNGNKMS